ncbi:MAG: hypothetical protein COA78_33005 [Blastopirellula sp.]|nr:MAG: hypothetical protein COA78_33005 [Blastopirellula sp.]
MKLLDPKDPFYKPFWMRGLITGILLAWAVFEALTGEPFWAILFGAAGVWCARLFFFSPKNDGSER